MQGPSKRGASFSMPGGAWEPAVKKEPQWLVLLGLGLGE